jgi:hypothetical protein
MPKGRGGAREGRRWGGVFFRKQPRKDKRGGHFRSPLSKSNLLILSWRGGAQPIMNDQETILVVQKFNTRGLAIKLSN